MQNRFHIVLVEPIYDGNIGSAARVMKNFGFNNLALVNPPKIGPEGRRNAMHARSVMAEARVFESFDDILGEYDFYVGTTAKVAGDANRVRTPVFIEELAESLNTDGDIAILFGREDNGLYNEEILKCDMLTTIPVHQEYGTLNLAQSVGIICYELSRQANKMDFTDKKFRELSGIEKDTLLRFYDELVDEVLPHDFERDISRQTFRNVVGRSFVSAREARTMTGLFRKAREKILGER